MTPAILIASVLIDRLRFSPLRLQQRRWGPFLKARKLM
jgi:hypothetical protein